jgi:hypothetical protein
MSVCVSTNAKQGASVKWKADYGEAVMNVNVV